MRIDRAGLVLGGIAAAAIAITLAVVGSASAAVQVHTLAVDVDTSGNTPTSIGPTDRCASIALGESVDVDVVVDSIPPFTGDGGGIAGWGLNFLYDQSVISVTGKAPLATTSLLGANGDSLFYSFGDPIPDSDGDFVVVDLDGGSTYESGKGTLFRLTVTGVGAGTSQLTLSDTTGGDFDGIPDLYNSDTTVYPIPNVKGALVFVGDPCPIVLPPVVGVAISGKITNDSGDPVGGALVEAEPTACCGGGATTLSESDGSYHIDGLPPSNYYVSASASGYIKTCYLDSITCLSPDVVTVGEDTPATGVDMTLHLPGSISGRITDVNGNPVVGADVSASIYGCCKVHGSATADENGDYTIVGLQPGTYTVFAQQGGFISQCYSGWSNYCSIPPANLVTVNKGENTSGVDMTLLRPGRITGRVLDVEGTPIGGAYVSVQAWGCCGTSATTTSGPDGSYELQVAVEANYYVYASAYGYFDQCFELVSDCSSPDLTPLEIGPDTAVDHIDFHLEKWGKISGRITDYLGNPIEGSALAGVPGRCCGTAAGAGSEGAYVIDGLRTGDYYVFASGPYLEGFVPECFDDLQVDYQFDCETRGTLVQVTNGQTTEGIDFQLNQLGRVSGKVTSLDGTPIPNALVLLEGDVCCTSGEATTDYDGNFSIFGLATGQYHGYAVADGFRDECFREAETYADAETLSIDLNDSIAGVDFSLAEGDNSVSFSLSSATAHAGETVTLSISTSSNFCPGLRGIFAALKYDPNLFTVVGCDSPCITFGDSLGVNANDQHGLSGVIGTISFQIGEAVTPGSYPIPYFYVHCYSLRSEIECAATPGTITIIEPNPPPPKPKDCKSSASVSQFLQCRREAFLVWWHWWHEHHKDCIDFSGHPPCNP